MADINFRLVIDTKAAHAALDDVLDHIDEVNEAMGVYASGVLDDEFDGPAIGDIVQLASGSPDMTVIDFCDECGEATVAYYDGNMVVMTFPIEALLEAD